MSLSPPPADLPLLPPADLPQPPLTGSPPPPADPPQVLDLVSIGSVLAALAKLNVKVSIEEFLRIVRDQEKAKLNAELGALLLQRKSAQLPVRPLIMSPPNVPRLSPTNWADDQPWYIHRLQVRPQPFPAPL